MRQQGFTAPLAYSDNFRSTLTYVVPPLITFGVAEIWFGSEWSLTRLFIALCIASVASALSYIVWTHLLFSRTPHERLTEIAAHQQRARTSALLRATGFNNQDPGSLAVGSAVLTIAVAIAAIIVGQAGQSMLLPLLVLATAATSWATMVYAFALKYFRLNAAGERIEFDIDEAPRFGDFVSMSVMVSSIGAMSAGTPRTRKGLATVRTHTCIAFVFNALVVAMTVSILGSMVQGL